ncbi:hypothetical protein WJX73_000142 [Symbiochloris irregularis]|uniref:polyribonucleotide nucleotidyltransferase n=1 Tax=Symbiochloris irregularis TaxID=706552 RepID=A0AAW1PF90_9CHLO
MLRLASATRKFRVLQHCRQWWAVAGASELSSFTLPAQTVQISSTAATLEAEPLPDDDSGSQAASPAALRCFEADEPARQRLELRAGQELALETGRLAHLAGGSCLAIQGNTQVLATTVCGSASHSFTPRELMLELQYQEKMSAAGRMPSQARRSAGPGTREKEVSGRIRRVLSPLFPEGLQNPVQVNIEVLSSDGAADLEAQADEAALTEEGLDSLLAKAAAKTAELLTAQSELAAQISPAAPVTLIAQADAAAVATIAGRASEQQLVCIGISKTGYLAVGQRGLLDLRPLHLQAGILPGPHASVLATAGDSQSLATLTVGGLYDERTFLTLTGPGSTRIAMQAGIAPSAVNQVALSRWRHANNTHEIPAQWQDRLVAGVALALMPEQTTFPPAAEDHASGQSSRWEALVDPGSLELEAASCLLQVAGTRAGITAVGLESSVASGLPMHALSSALKVAKRARLQVLDSMQARLAPAQAAVGQKLQFGSMDLVLDKVARVIGAGGSTVKGLEASTGATVQVFDNQGTDAAPAVHYFTTSSQQRQAIEQALTDLLGTSFQAGQVYPGTVVKLTDFGAFIRMRTGFEALLHVSEMAHGRVRSPEDVLAVGQSLDVMT